MTEEDQLNAIDATLKGDIARFEELVVAYQSQVLRLAHGVTGDADRARDIAQDAFIAAFRQLSRYDPFRARFITWLLTITRNLAIKSNRKYARGQSPEAASEDSLSVQMDKTNPVERLHWKETFTTLDKALAALPTRWRAAFTLTEIDSLTYEEAARVEGVPVGTIRSRVFRSRKRLREALADDGLTRITNIATKQNHAT